MKKRRTTKARSLSYIFALFVVLVSITLLIVTIYIKTTFRNFFISHLQNDLTERALVLAAHLSNAKTSELRKACTLPAQAHDLRVTVIHEDGTILCDTDADPRHMDNHRDRPEIAAAFTGKTSSRLRYSDTLGTDLLYVAVPLTQKGEKIAVIRHSIPLLKIDKHLEKTAFRLLLLSIVACALIGALAFILYRQIRKPLGQMRREAEKFALGQFDQKLPQYEILEVAELATAMNQMGGQLKHLEAVRSDFVANVSHELKTPITSIKGFIETLLDGAMEDPGDLQRFLEIIAKQSDRLTAIIDDLLTLSRLESKHSEGQLMVFDTAILDVIQATVDMCKAQAEAKSIRLEVQCPKELVAPADRSLLEQAIANLVYNAIKYSGSESTVEISGFREKDEVVIQVKDHGPGIPQEHLSRIFERFYRVDKARSRDQGGTGLGLAIVKHVTGVHGGKVEVASTLGKGSIFSIKIPKS